MMPDGAVEVPGQGGVLLSPPGVHPRGEAEALDEILATRLINVVAVERPGEDRHGLEC
jgi:hypothetical protein